ncbi:carboxypeptidase-like regulatory domain-containing protein [Thermus filiformis]|uniref:carboxypeptidase-like regulatory domain-containing protein n=1 Tax=Thermus filiformis TaxID=276 RepID=UPI00057121E8|nr:carboxypeptidase-like regulatory domain-containing protein [Thermus filiformis]
MRPIPALFLASFLLAFLGSGALAQEAVPVQPGSVVTLVFPGPLPEERAPRVDPPLRLLLASESPPYLVLVEVPETAPPGVYRVCLGECREVRVGERRALEVKLQAGGGLLLFRARNGGNVPELLPVRPAEESEVRFAPFRLELAPGEAKDLEVPLRGRGLLVLEVGEGRYLLRVEPEEGPPPPALLGKLALSTEEAKVEAGLKGEALSLEAALLRSWSGDYRASLKAATPQARFFLDSGGYLELGLNGGPLSGGLNLEDAVFGLNPESLSFSLLSTFPTGFAPLLPSVDDLDRPLERATLGLRGSYAFGKGLGSLSFSLARGPWSLALGYPLFAEGRVYLPELRGGELYARLDETGGRLRLSFPPYALEVGLLGGPFGSLEYASFGGGLSYRLKAGYQTGAFLEGGLGYRAGAYGLSLGGRVGSNASLYLAGDARLGEVALRGLVSYPFSGSPSGFLEAEGQLEDVKVFLRGEYLRGLAFRAGAALPFSLDLPELQSLLYPSFALLQGKTLPGGEVRVGSYRAIADGEGRFALRLPPGTYRVSALPPAGVLALPEEREVRLPPGGEASLVLLPLRAVRVEVVCEAGAGRVRLVGERTGAEVRCGESALLPEGTYRAEVFPEKGFA